MRSTYSASILITVATLSGSSLILGCSGNSSTGSGGAGGAGSSNAASTNTAASNAASTNSAASTSAAQTTSAASTSAASTTSAATTAAATSSSTGSGGGVCGVCQTGAFCDPNLGCVQCLTSANCPNVAPGCVAGQCFECAVNADCGGNKICDVVQHQCTNACTAQSCNNNAPICDATTKSCVQCLTTNDCQAPQICNTQLGTCGNCNVNADCAGGLKPYCDALNGTCVTCLGNAQCGANQACSGGSCVTACTPQSCPQGKPICDTSGVCVECVVSTDCPNQGDACVGGVCAG